MLKLNHDRSNVILNPITFKTYKSTGTLYALTTDDIRCENKISSKMMQLKGLTVSAEIKFTGNDRVATAHIKLVHN